MVWRSREGWPHLASVVVAILAILCLCFAAMGARAQIGGQSGGPPTGLATLNQAISARPLTKSDATIFEPTRGINIGDAAACTIVARFNTDTFAQAVTLTNQQSGSDHPYSIVQLLNATTCTAVTAFY